MIKILIAILFIIIGLIGIIKNKFPKYKDGLGYAAAMRYYLSFWGLLLLGISLLINWIFK